MGTLNRAVTTVKKWFGIKKLTIAEPTTLMEAYLKRDIIPERRGNGIFIPNKQAHSLLQERKLKRRENGMGKKLNLIKNKQNDNLNQRFHN